MANGDDSRFDPRRRVGRYYSYKGESSEGSKELYEAKSRGENWMVGYRHAAGDVVYKMPHVNLGMIAPYDDILDLGIVST